ncbi:MAG: hypothetical protein HWE09_00070 [Cyclobacteriaceae bacterium]|nr:hypothetical protein [Cyclobacteriaceae bacterium]
MIKFFRKIRQRLLTQNQFSKYLIYAVGEIVLVVIGILIALQINNWNTAKVQERQRQNFLTDLGEEIRKTQQNDFNPFTIYSQYFLEMDSILELIQENRLNEAEYRANEDLLLPMFSSKHTGILRENVNYLTLENGNNILKIRSEFPEKYEHLLYLLKAYQDGFEIWKTQTQETFEEQKSFRSFMQNEYEWFYPLDSIDISKAIDFSINNKNYRSRVEVYRRNFAYIIRALSRVRNYQVFIMAEIERLSGGSTADIKRVIEEFDFLPMETVSCDDNSTELKPAEFQFNIIYNSTKQPFKVHRLNSSYKPFESFDIAPNQIMGFGQSVGMLFQVEMNGACYKRFKVIPDGYLLIE